MSRFRGFAPDAIRFLRALKRNNRRDWFQPRREEYERLVRAPLADLVEEVDVRLGTVAPEILGDPKRSVFRIYRDVRFSKDKSPYKTHAGAWFYHRDAGKEVGSRAAHGGAGFYFHIGADETLVAGGFWMPPRPALSAIRAALARDHESFEQVVESAAFRRRFGGLSDEAVLTRTPRGIPADHPAAHWLRHQSFTASRTLTRAEALSPRLVTSIVRDFERLLPLVRWLNAAVGFRPAPRRFVIRSE
ncbi:MAG TPA: DUF2461 domain-containing protein [Gemmatimonadaceae bacterium]|nr:DUF2461 domain-containing protein [Gemmatimonadaceae bacterium]